MPGEVPAGVTRYVATEQPAQVPIGVEATAAVAGWAGCDRQPRVAEQALAVQLARQGSPVAAATISVVEVLCRRDVSSLPVAVQV